MKNNDFAKMQKLAFGKVLLKENQESENLSFKSSDLVNQLWNYDDEGFWEDTGFNRDSLESFKKSIMKKPVEFLLQNYLDVIGDSSSNWEKVKNASSITLDGKDVTNALKSTRDTSLY